MKQDVASHTHTHTHIPTHKTHLLSQPFNMAWTPQCTCTQTHSLPPSLPPYSLVTASACSYIHLSHDLVQKDTIHQLHEHVDPVLRAHPVWRTQRTQRLDLGDEETETERGGQVRNGISEQTFYIQHEFIFYCTAEWWVQVRSSRHQLLHFINLTFTYAVCNVALALPMS